MLSTFQRASERCAPTRIMAMPSPVWLSVVRVVTWSMNSSTVARSPSSDVTPLLTTLTVTTSFCSGARVFTGPKIALYWHFALPTSSSLAAFSVAPTSAKL